MPKWSRHDYKERGLEEIVRSDGTKWWRVRIVHHGKGNRFGPFQSKADAHKFYVHCKDLIRQGCYFPEEFKKMKKPETTRLPRNVKEIREAWEKKDIRKVGVYFIQPVVGGFIKIGFSGNVPSRFRQIQYQCPIPLKLLGVIEGDLNLEYRIHMTAIKERHHGEWFFPKGRLLGLMHHHDIMPVDAMLHFAKDWEPKFLSRLQKHFEDDPDDTNQESA